MPYDLQLSIQSSQRKGAKIPMPIPRYPGDITVEWLSAVLSKRRHLCALSDVDVTAIGTGQTGATYRVSVDVRR